jgi:hypothetical protein
VSNIIKSKPNNFLFYTNLSGWVLSTSICYNISSNLVQQFQYFMVRAKVINSFDTKGFRATIYKCAQDCSAYYNIDVSHSIWYEQGSKDLSICLLFRSESDARIFQNNLANFSLFHVSLANRIEFDEGIYEVNLNAKPMGIFFSHYDTKLYGSPECLSLNTIAMSSSKADVDPSDPLVQRRCLEDISLCRPGSKLFRCHIADKAKYPKYANDEDNIICGTSDFHESFDGSMTLSGRPDVAIKFEGVREKVTINNNCQGWKVSIILEFFDKNIAAYMSNRLKSGTERIDELNFRSFIIANEPKKLEKYLNIKYKQTMELWDI